MRFCFERISFSLPFIFFLFLSYSCSEESEEIPYIPIDEITASETELYPDRENNSVTTTLSFKNIEKIDYLMLSLSDGEAYSERIEGSELNPSYLFTYRIRDSDPVIFKLVLMAVYHDGNVSKKLFLTVDNRRGFRVRKVSCIARVTGKSIMGEGLISPNNTHLAWNVGGTDLGIIWEMEPDRWGLFFGDTFGRDFTPNSSHPGPNGGSWRSNVLAFSEDDSLEDGLTISSMAVDVRGVAREIVPSAKSGSDVTSIPTAAIHANGADYVHFFNMRNWDTWTTNYSGLFKSSDGGKVWQRVENVSFSSNSPFGQAGYFKKDDYVYMVGTQTGRNSKASLARFRERDIEDRERYEYWNGSSNSWKIGNERDATPIIDDQVGELSFIYNSRFGLWIIAYFNGPRYNITMRTAKEVTGPWSEPFELASGWEYSQLYGSYFHPLSADSDTLYFTMSMWLPYNVFLMKVELSD